jgi:hypothetical protein
MRKLYLSIITHLFACSRVFAAVTVEAVRYAHSFLSHTVAILLSRLTIGRLGQCISLLLASRDDSLSKEERIELRKEK